MSLQSVVSNDHNIVLLIVLTIWVVIESPYWGWLLNPNTEPNIYPDRDLNIGSLEGSLEDHVSVIHSVDQYLPQYWS